MDALVPKLIPNDASVRARPTLRPHQHERLQRVLGFIEASIGRRTTLQELARVAAIAPHHFHRLFTRFAGEGVVEHVRRLRLERAGFELFTSGASVTDVSRRCGYASPAAFARAFTRQFGLSPRRFRRDWCAAGYFVDVAPDLRRDFDRAPPELRDEPEKRLKFLRRPGPLAAASHAGRAAIERLLSDAPRSADAAIYERTPDFPPVTPPNRLRIDAAFAGDVLHRPSDELAEQVLPAGRFAVFHLEAGKDSKETVVQLWNYAYLVWAPRHRVRIRSFGAYEVHRRRAGRPHHVEVHLPVEPAGGAGVI